MSSKRRPTSKSYMNLKKALSRKQKREVTAIAKKTILAISETKAVGKQTAGEPTVPAIALFHNKAYYQGSLLTTSQGVLDPNDYSSSAARVGDELLLKNMNVRFLLSAFRPNVTYKAVLFWYGSELSALTDAIVYFTQQNKMLDRYNNEQISIIDQKIISPNIGALPADDANPRRTRLFTLNGNWKAKKITYDEGSTNPRFKNIGFAIVCYDSINTAQTEQLGEIVFDYKMKFKDL